MYIHRKIEKLLKKAIRQFPVCLITGARQVGKSTLIKNLLKEYTYVTFDDPFTKKAAQDDPELFLSSYKIPLIIDEVQYVPEIFSYLKTRVDENRHEYGQYVLTGSQVFQLMQNVSESLAGRIAIFELYPLSYEEIFEHEKSDKCFEDDQLIQRMTAGFFPESFHMKKRLDPQLWFGSYVSTYLERDVRNIKQVLDLSRFQTFLQLLASRAAQLLNITEVSKECGVSQSTIKDWLSVLESTYIIKILRPYFTNHNKRYIKTPKVYFLDTGLLCYLLGIDSERLLKAREKGNIFENMIFMEVVKRLSCDASHTPIYFYRTSHGSEVDLIIEKKGKTYAYEIKFSKTLTKEMAKGLKEFLTSHEAYSAKILSLQERPLPFYKEIQGLHWKHLLEE